MALPATLNVGQGENDGTGDRRRDAFVKIQRCLDDLDYRASRAATADDLTDITQDILGKLDKAGDASGTKATPNGAPFARSMADRFADIAWLPDYKLTPEINWEGAFNRAIATGKEVYVPAGTYTVATPIILQTGTTIRGAGRGIATIKLANGANCDVIQTQGAYSLFGTQTQAGVLRWKISDLTIDGNRANQTTLVGNGRDSVNGIASYGAAWTIHCVIIQNCLGNGLRTEHAQGGGAQDDLTLDIYKLAIDTCGRNGWDFAGPHDGHVVMLEVIDAGQDADNTFYGVKTYKSGAAKWLHFHGWHRAAATNRVAYQFYGNGANTITTSDFEGGRGQYYGAGNDIVSTSRFYSHFGAPGTAMVVLAAGGNTFSGNAFLNDTSADCYGLQIGTSGSACGVASVVGSTFNTFVTRGPVNFVNDGGANIIEGTGYAAQGGPTTVGGTISPLSTVNLSIQGQGLEVHQTSPRPWASFTPVVTADSGTITAYTASARTTRNGNTVTVSGRITITTRGTAVGTFQATLPAAPKSGGSGAVTVMNTSAGNVAYGALTANGFQALVPGADGQTLVFTAVYEAQ